jgi:hypothetical protein
MIHQVTDGKGNEYRTEKTHGFRHRKKMTPNVIDGIANEQVYNGVKHVNGITYFSQGFQRTRDQSRHVAGIFIEAKANGNAASGE